jgi:PmbA protein
MIGRILQQAMKNADAAEVTFSRSESTPVSFENDKLKAIKVSQSTEIALRVVVDGKLGSSRSSDTENPETLVERAIEVARFGSDAHFRFPGPNKAPEVKICDASVKKMSKERMVEIGREMLHLLKGYDPDILVNCGVSRSFGEREYANSSGHVFKVEGTFFSVHAGGTRIRGTEILCVYEGRTWRTPDIVHVGLTGHVIEKFHLAERTSHIRSGDMPVILTPDAVLILLLPLSMGLNGSNVLKGDSPLAGRLGQEIAHTGLTVTDNPLVDYAPASGGYDGEGVPHQITLLIEKGILRDFLYDLDTAGRLGVKSTGNSPGCQPTNLLVNQEIPHTKRWSRAWMKDYW